MSIFAILHQFWDSGNFEVEAAGIIPQAFVSRADAEAAIRVLAEKVLRDDCGYDDAGVENAFNYDEYPEGCSDLDTVFTANPGMGDGDFALVNPDEPDRLRDDWTITELAEPPA